MGIVSKVLGLFLGDKYDRDIKEISPYVEKTLSEYSKLQSLSNDELRDKTVTLKKHIVEYVADEERKLEELKLQAEAEEDFDAKEDLYDKIDKLEKEISDKLEVVLDESVPLAFAIVKETARRFKENDVLEVTARQYDRELAVTRESITIEGDKAFWKNRWIAGGNEIVWDMCHYDVQLIGGVALHKGKIAEMSTGEGKTLVATLPVFLNALTAKTYFFFDFSFFIILETFLALFTVMVFTLLSRMYLIS